ncbi:translation initiation factor [Puniceicoccaceae bacterium K14]|nr:translation initiation factor [Puniceicoccaceae bacterium K14]
MGKKKKRISTEGSEDALSDNPFAGLNLGDLPAAPEVELPTKLDVNTQKPKKNRGRLDVGRQKGGRGGKTVTVVTGFKGISQEEKQALAKKIQKSCGVGGSVKGGNVEIQGDKREEAKVILEEAGFRVVFVGG